jgi:uncharacterized protein YggE
MKKLFYLTTILLVLFMSIGCASQTSPVNVHTINATGTGKITVKPDTVEVRLSIISEGKDKSVQETNATKVQEAIDALLAIGLTKDELETQNLSFNPVYKWDEKNGQQIVGYRAENTLVVKTKSIDKAGSIADTAVENGVEMVGNLNFTLSDEGKEALLGQAIKKAVLDAKNQVELASKAAGVEIIGVQNINIIKESQSPPIYYNKLQVAKSEDSVETPVLPEDTQYTITVQATFEIK